VLRSGVSFDQHRLILALPLALTLSQRGATSRDVGNKKPPC